MRLAVVAAIVLVFAGAAQAQSEPAVGSCLGGSCTLGAQVAPAQNDAVRRPTRGFARGAAWFGVISAALSLGGAITIAALEDPGSERITRGVWLGQLALSVPLIAAGSYTTRKRARVESYRGLRALGWTAYAGVLPQGVALWYFAFRGGEIHPGLTVGAGCTALLAYLPHAFDAYVASRQARVKGLARFRPQGLGFVF